MNRRICLIILVILVFFPGKVLGFVFQDSTGLYSTIIPDQWVYQAHLSSAALVVFYGLGEDDLLYFEQLANVKDEDAISFGQRSLDLFAQAGGLKSFQLHEPLITLELAGLEAASCLYSYENEQKTCLWERRIFAVLPEQRGFSMALSDQEQSFFQNQSVLEGILANWRWLFWDLEQ